MQGLGFELDPPKILKGPCMDCGIFDNCVQLLLRRVRELAGLASAIHFTESVLGLPRVSSLLVGKMAKELVTSSTLIRCNVRTCDRNLNSLIQMAVEARLNRLNGLVLVRGDRPHFGEPSKLTPTMALRQLRSLAIADDSLKVFLASPCKLKKGLIDAKLAGEPDGLVTQPVGNLRDFAEFCDYVRSSGTSVIGSILVPCRRNLKVAKAIDFDWSAYEGDVLNQLKTAREYADEILVLSPNDFREGLKVLSSATGGPG